ncbi:tumor necrosis factor receptor superfamily member 18 [Microcaecilia unicolor]|uniref:Tumor necrosis factor receptor superfamily member 18 n=1 Tax=Microcaecilia unicolor TaxID=1415580 RepID=A0A6P7WUC7_9AMPH|nr:tumor necrosis factor receptor superfamily member 18 [Microcaecilia unicolor]
MTMFLHGRVVGSWLWNTCFSLFLLGPWFWAQPALALSCMPDHFQTFTVQGYKCCKVCPSEKAQDEPCQDAKDQDCKCAAGFQCHNPSCDYCLRLPACNKGQTIRRSGEQQYTYECTYCEDNTYYVPETGLCKKWTNCSSKLLDTITPGNRTHDAQCGSKLSPASLVSVCTHAVQLAILVAVAIFILILMSVFLHLYIWRMKRKKRNTTEGQEPFPFTSRPHPLEDTCSCQFPEEERGGKSGEEEILKSFPWN